MKETDGIRDERDALLETVASLEESYSISRLNFSAALARKDAELHTLRKLWDQASREKAKAAASAGRMAADLARFRFVGFALVVLFTVLTVAMSALASAGTIPVWTVYFPLLSTALLVWLSVGVNSCG